MHQCMFDQRAPACLTTLAALQILLNNVEDDDVTLLSTALWSMGMSGAFQQPLFRELLSDAVRMPRRALEDSTLVPDLAVARIYQVS